jgi:hypothetical protein
MMQEWCCKDCKFCNWSNEFNCRVCVKARSDERIVSSRSLWKCKLCYHLLDQGSRDCKRAECKVTRYKQDKGFHPKNKYKEHACECSIDGCKKSHLAKGELANAITATSWTPYCRDLYLGRPCKNGMFCYYLHDELQPGRIPVQADGSSSSSGVSSSSSSSGVSSSMKRAAPVDAPRPQSKVPKVDDRGRQNPKARRKEISISDSEDSDDHVSVPAGSRSRSKSSKAPADEEWTVVKRSPPPKRSPERKHSRDRKK